MNPARCKNHFCEGGSRLEKPWEVTVEAICWNYGHVPQLLRALADAYEQKERAVNAPISRIHVSKSDRWNGHVEVKVR